MSATEPIEDINAMELQQEQEYDPGADANQVIPPPERDAEGHAIEYKIRLTLAPNKKDENADRTALDNYTRPEKGMYFTRGKEAIKEFAALIEQGISDKEARKKIAAEMTTDKQGNQRRRFPIMGILAVNQVIAEGEFAKTPVGTNWLNTLLSRSGTTTVADMMNKAGHTFPKGLTLEQQAEQVNYWLGEHPDADGNPTEGLIVSSTLQWTAWCKAEEMEIKELKGERNWPVRYDGDGNQIGHYAASTVIVEADGTKRKVDVECPNCSSPIVANARVAQYLLSL